MLYVFWNFKFFDYVYTFFEMPLQKNVFGVFKKRKMRILKRLKFKVQGHDGIKCWKQHFDSGATWRWRLASGSEFGEMSEKMPACVSTDDGNFEHDMNWVVALNMA